MESGKEGRCSGELAGDKVSKPKEEQPGSGSNESGFKLPESECSVEDRQGVCAMLGTGNTELQGGDKVGNTDEVELVAVAHLLGQQEGSDSGNTVLSERVRSRPDRSGTETRPLSVFNWTESEAEGMEGTGFVSSVVSVVLNPSWSE